MNTFPISLLAKDIQVTPFKVKEINMTFNSINVAAKTLNVDAVILLNAVEKQQSKIENYTIIYKF